MPEQRGVYVAGDVLVSARVLALAVLAFTLGCEQPTETADTEDTEETSSGICEAGEPCETLHDCPPSGIDCVIGVCVRGSCQWVNLATVATLPVDPYSGLPIGKGCH